MATDVPFGLSFGNPAKYMGQSPLAEIGKAAKTGLILYGLQQSGAIKALDKLGVKPNQAGTLSYNNPAAPTSAVPPVGVAAQPVMPNANVQRDNPLTPAIATPVYDSAAPPMSTTPPANIGFDVLDGKYNGAETSFVSPQAQRDSLVLPQQTGYNTMLATGNEYQQMPGYGKLSKAMQGMAGGMMG
tara:strand:- start:3636 stop:4193 length:558 start_codon:yes stop_codon:yes gene_type:complete